MATYRGFSTYNRKKKFRLTDFELAKQDLFNHLNIRKGEKLSNPDFGSIIWGLLFEPLTPSIKTAISDDLIRIVGSDPRWSLTGINIIEYEHGIRAELSVVYIPSNQTALLATNFARA